MAADLTTSELLADTGSPVHARVQAFWDGGRASTWLGPRAELHVGRGSDCGLQIDHSSVSRRHAVLRGGTPAYVEDVGSANGVFVRGVRIPSGTPVAVFPGDVIALGAVLVVVQQPLAVATERPAMPSLPPPGAEAPMEVVLRLIELVAASDLSVLLLGETGVGKTTAAATLHEKSARTGRPFVRIHCPSFPEALLESELFGHEKGAFTGAAQAKSGLIESADGGTVFLDEIGELPLTTQAKLLSVVESRELLRLGSVKARAIDVRFIAATNRDLEAQVRAGAFRQDLFYRLDGLSIVIPPLRKRVAEIAPLARQLLDQAASHARRTPLLLSDEAIAMLEAQPWPGNVRELRNVIDRLVVLCAEPVLLPQHFAAVMNTQPRASSPTIPPVVAVPTESTLRDELDAVERSRIEAALESCHGNQSEAAKLLGMSRRTLIRRIEQHALPRPRKG